MTPESPNPIRGQNLSTAPGYLEKATVNFLMWAVASLLTRLLGMSEFGVWIFAFDQVASSPVAPLLLALGLMLLGMFLLKPAYLKARITLAPIGVLLVSFASEALLTRRITRTRFFAALVRPRLWSMAVFEEASSLATNIASLLMVMSGWVIFQENWGRADLWAPLILVAAILYTYGANIIMPSAER